MSWTHADFAAIAELVNTRTGLAFDNRHQSAELGIRRAMGRARIQDLDKYAGRLAVDDGAFDDLISELTIGETYFFREAGHFRFIEREILPEIARRRGPQHPVRAWSASCASGEEAYSLAILFHQQGIAAAAQIVATDISRTALAKARQAVYGSWSMRGEGAARTLPYLAAAGKEFRLDETIRRRVAISHLNLALDAYPSFANGLWGMDLILCRNVLIYFDRHTVTQVARRLFQTLAEGGWLITASSDPPLWDEAPFQVVTSEDGMFYRRATADVSPSLNPPAELAYDPQSALTGVRDESSVVRDSASGGREPPVSTRHEERNRGLTPPARLTTDKEARTTDLRNALARGDHAKVVELTRECLDDAPSAALHVRALANLDAVLAQEVCAQMVQRHALVPELHFLLGVLLLDARRFQEAAQALRRVLYLDRTLAVGHFTFGSILRQLGDWQGAARSYRNARDLCTARPPEEPVRFADGECAGRLAEVAGAELLLLEAEAAS